MLKKFFRKLGCLFSATTPQEKQRGKVKFFDKKKRFGFIISEKNEYFFHAASVTPGDFKRLRDGADVLFILTEGKKGLQADRIEIL